MERRRRVGRGQHEGGAVGQVLGDTVEPVGPERAVGHRFPMFVHEEQLRLVNRRAPTAAPAAPPASAARSPSLGSGGTRRARLDQFLAKAGDLLLDRLNFVFIAVFLPFRSRRPKEYPGERPRGLIESSWLTDAITSRRDGHRRPAPPRRRSRDRPHRRRRYGRRRSRRRRHPDAARGAWPR